MFANSSAEHRVPVRHHIAKTLTRYSRAALLPCILAVLPFIVLTPLWLPEPFRVYLLAHGHAWPQYAWIDFLLVELREGRLPLWSPYVGAGYPFVASIYNEILNPFVLLMLPTVTNGKLPYVAYEVTAALQWSFSGLTFFYMTRRLGILPVSAFIASLSYLFNLYSFGNLLLWSATAKVMAWMPVIFVLILRYFDARNASRHLNLVLAAALFGLTYTHPYTSIVVLIFFICLLAVGSASAPGPWLSRTMRACFAAGLFATISMCSAGAMFFPFLESMLINPRLQVSPPYWIAFSPSGFMESILSLILPDFVHPLRWVYFGPGFLALAVVGFWRTRGWLPRFLAASVAMAFVVSLVQWSALYFVLFKLVPTWSSIREQTTSLHIVAFALPVLIGWGGDHVRRLLSGVGVEGWRKAKSVATALVCLGTVSIVNEIILSALGAPPANALMSMRSIQLYFAGLLLLILVLAGRGAISFKAFVAWSAIIMFMNQLIPLWHIRDYRPTRPGIYFELLTASRDAPPPDRSAERRRPSTDRSAVRAFATRTPTLNDYGSQNLYRFLRLTARAGVTSGAAEFYLPTINITLGANKRLLDLLDTEDAADPIGRFALIDEAVVVVNGEQALEILDAPSMDFRRQLVLESPVDERHHDPGRYPGIRDTSMDGITIRRYEPSRVDLEVANGRGRRFLLFTDNWYAGWHAEINGAEVQVLRADYTFKAIAVPPGRFDVRFTFWPLSYRVGSAATVVTWLLIGVVGVGVWYRRRA